MVSQELRFLEIFFLRKCSSEIQLNLDTLGDLKDNEYLSENTGDTPFSIKMVTQLTK